MKRNREKFEYVDLSLLRASKLYGLLLADAENMSQSIAQTILMRVAISYGLLSSGSSIEAPEPAPKQKIDAAPMTTRPAAKSPQARIHKEALTPPVEESDDIPNFDMASAMASADLFDL